MDKGKLIGIFTALLLILVLLSSLYYFDVPVVKQTCLFQKDFECVGPAQFYIDETGELQVNVEISNQLGKNATKIKAVCTNTHSGNIDNEFFTNAGSNVVIPEVTSINTEQAFTIDSVPCVNSSGDPLILNEGYLFKGILVIKYTIENKEKISIATISGTVTKR